MNTLCAVQYKSKKMLETDIFDIKQDCMWSDEGCHKNICTSRMDSFLSKSPLSDSYTDIYLNNLILSPSSEPIELLDDDFNVNDLFSSSNSSSQITSGQSNQNQLNNNNNNNNNTNNNNNNTSSQQSSNTTTITPYNYYAPQSQTNNSTAVQSSSVLMNSSNTINQAQSQLTLHQNRMSQSQAVTIVVNPNKISSYNHQSSSLNAPLTPNSNYSSSPLSVSSTSQSSSILLNSSLNNEKNVCYLNDLLLSSSSANIILTQHNQQSLDSNSQLSQLSSNHHPVAEHHNNNNHNNNHTHHYTPNHANLDNLNPCTDLVVSSNDVNALDDSHNQQFNNTQLSVNPIHYNNYQINTNHTMMSNYSSSFENHLMDSAFCSAGDSAGSSNNSECSSSCLLERTDYDTDDIEDDLDLLEDIIEEEIDHNLFAMHQNNMHNNYAQSRSVCHSIANSLESSSDVDMSIASPISDSLINDHSYGACAIDKACEKLSSSQYIVNATNNRTSSLMNNMAINTSSSNHARNNHSSATLIHHVNPNNTVNRISKRRPTLANLTSHQNQNQAVNSVNNRRSLQRHSGTSLLMKDKQSKIKKVMDTDRRKEHNESERMRRDVLKNAFLNLKNRCPKLSNSAKKASRIQILNEATSFIHQINDKFDCLKDLREQERQRNEELKAKLLSLGGC